jgi:hypothetical protein
MPPSHVKKEEAELRQIAKQSRNARKEAQERERKQRQRALRAAAKSGEGEAKETAAAAVTAPKKKRGAIILPDEVAELRQRLLGNDVQHSSNASSAADAANKKSKRKTVKNGGVAASAAVGTPSPSASSSFLVPTFHQEVHFKKNIFFVDVVLHHVPHQKIDVSETNNRQLVVDTTKFTKKYRLVLPFPDGMRCDAAAAEYEFERGVLSCKLPIVEGTLPATLTEENKKMVEQMRQQRALRFRVTQDGDLTVRTRQALLAPTPEAQAALLQAAKEAKKAGGGVAGGDAAEVSAKDRKRKRAGEANAAAEAAVAVTDEKDSAAAVVDKQPVKAAKKTEKTTAVAAAASSSEKPPTKAAKPDVFQTEHAKAMEAAKAAAEKVHLSMREKMKLAKTVQASRQERLQTRSQRKEMKEEKKQQSFQRVLEEQKRQLLARAALQQPQPPRAAAKSDGPIKSVHFADA